MAGVAIIVREVILTTSYQAVSATAEIASVRITNEGTHTNYMLGDDGVTDVPIKAGGQFDFHGVDLSTIQVKGTTSDIITIIGPVGRW